MTKQQLIERANELEEMQAILGYSEEVQLQIDTNRNAIENYND